MIELILWSLVLLMVQLVTPSVLALMGGQVSVAYLLQRAGRISSDLRFGTPSPACCRQFARNTASIFGARGSKHHKRYRCHLVSPGVAGLASDLSWAVSGRHRLRALLCLGWRVSLPDWYGATAALKRPNQPQLG